LFGGGFSITHFMLKRRSKDYKEFHFNEIRTGICELIKDSIAGKYNYSVYSPPWISREDFFAKKEIDPMVKIIWSFGNNGSNYLFGKDIEQDKKSMHMAIVFNEFDDRAKEIFGMEKFRDGFSIIDKRLSLKNRIKDEQLQRLEQLERLQQLQRLERLQQLSFYTGSYSDVPIKENSIIYCDIPYQGTAGYGDFSHKDFFNWAHKQKNPVYISEYNISDSRFKLISSLRKISLLSSKREYLQKDEKVYVNRAGWEKIKRPDL
jgi:hypothetical protein